MNTNYYMDLAIEQAKKGLKINEVPIGAILVDDVKNNIIAAFHNEVVKQNNPIKHAEILVIDRACKIKNSRYLDHTSIFITLEPCAMCASAISEARIEKLYFGAYDEKRGAIESTMNIFNKKNYYIPEIYGGIKEMECSLLLKSFFNLLRKKDGKKTKYSRI